MPTPKQHASAADKQRAYRERQKQARTEEQQAKGLPALPRILTLPGTARWKTLIEAARLQLETARDEMQDYLDERSQEWQGSDRAESHRARLESIEAAIAALEEVEF